MAQKVYTDNAEVMPQGQITIPRRVLDALGIPDGGKVTFIIDRNDVRIVNSAVYAMQALQGEMVGRAQEVGLETEDNIVSFVKELRRKSNTK